MNIKFEDADLRFYFSFQCPYSYMTWEILKTLLKDTDLFVEPVEIGLFPLGNTKFHFREIWAEARWERLQEDAEKVGIKVFNQPREYSNSLYTARALNAYTGANAEDYISSIFRNFFSSNLNLAHASSIKTCLQSDGVDYNLFEAAIKDPETEARAVSMCHLWGTQRIRVLPTVEFDDCRYAGFIDRYGLERFLRALID